MGVRVLQRSEIAQRILDGETIVIYRNRVLRIPPAWLEAHPAGPLAILHFVGRDAADEVDAFHGEQTLKRALGYTIGELCPDELARTGGAWQPLVPPVMTGWVRRIAPDGTQTWFNEAKAVYSTEDTEISPSSEIMLVERAEPTMSGAAPSLSTLTPPPTGLSLEVQARHSAAYKELHQKITEAGFYQCRYVTGYGPEVARYMFLVVASTLCYSRGWIVPSAVFLGMLWHQLVFTVHDLGHMGVTHDWSLDRFIGIMIADFMGGLSVGWWVDNHNIHHLVTNHPSHDPDIEHLPFFAVTTKFFNSVWSSYYKHIFPYDAASAFFVQFQHNLFYVVLGLARFNLYRLSYAFLIKKALSPKKAKGAQWSFWMEVAGIVFFWSWYIAVLRGCGSWGKGLTFFLISNIVPSPLHVQIVLSHFSRSTADLGPTESFPHRQLRTTADVICPPHLAFLHGGLHLQVTHHLFPRLPRHNLLAASHLVKAFAAEQGLEYAEFGFVEGNLEVRGVLRAVADQVRLVGRVAREEVREAVAGKKAL